MLTDLPHGSRCFVDTNILYYHFVQAPALSELCSLFLERFVTREITAYCSTPILADLVHKVMMTEARQFSGPGVSAASLSKQLGQTKRLVRQLKAYALVPSQLRAIPLQMLPVEISHLGQATQISQSDGLLTNDAIIVALMREHSIEHLATNDDDFDHVQSITVWKPRS